MSMTRLTSQPLMLPLNEYACDNPSVACEGNPEVHRSSLM